MQKAKYEYDNGFKPKKVEIKDNYNFYPSSFIYKIINFTILLITKILIIVPKILIGFKVTGKKNIKDIKKAIFISNHVHFMDAFLIGTTLFPKRLYCTTLKSNLGFSFISSYFRLCGAVPIPTNLNHKKKFLTQSINTLKENSILFYPEGSLILYCNRIREFDTGAFNIAIKSNSLIVPIILTFHKSKGLYKLIRPNKPLIHLNILKTYQPTDKIKAKDELYEIMTAYFLNNSDFFTNDSNS